MSIHHLKGFSPQIFLMDGTSFSWVCGSLSDKIKGMM